MLILNNRITDIGDGVSNADGVSMQQLIDRMGMGLTYQSGRYYGTFKSGAISSLTTSSNNLYAVPIFIHTAQTFSAIGVYVTTAVASKIRMGIYTNISGLPGNLVLDAGEVTVTLALAQQYDLSISQTLNSGWYWLALVANGINVITALSANNLVGSMLGYPDANTEAPRISKSFTYGALPASFGAVTYTSAQSLPNIMLKAA